MNKSSYTYVRLVVGEVVRGGLLPRSNVYTCNYRIKLELILLCGVSCGMINM